MLYCQAPQTESLNSICDIAYANESLWRSMGVTPPMRNMKMTIVRELRTPAAAIDETQILKDEIVKWSVRAVAEIYRDRWGIETFFKELKQTCQIHDNACISRRFWNSALAERDSRRAEGRLLREFAASG